MDPQQPAWQIVSDTIDALPTDLAFAGLAVAMLVVARLVKDVLTPYRLSAQMTTHDNVAVGLSVAGYYGGVLIVCLGPLATPSPGAVMWQDLLETAGYALMGIVFLNASRYVVDFLLLRDFSTVKEIIQDRNAGTGAVEMGVYLASGIVVAASLQGDGGGPQTSAAFFGLGVVGLLIYGALYKRLCGYDLHGEIERDNVAAGVALGLNLIAIGVVLLKGIAGDFVSWSVNLTRFGITFGLGLVLLFLLRIFVDAFILPGARVKDEIVQDRNLNAAFVEGTVLIGVAGMLVMIL